MKKLTTLGVLLATGAALLQAAPPASATTPLQIVTGTIKDTLGAVVPNAHVELLMWPGEDALSAAQVDDEVNLVSLASVDADSSGNFSLNLANLSALAPGAVGDNIADLEVVATLPSGEVSQFSFSRKLVNTNILGLTIEAAVDPESPDNVINNLISGLTQQLVVPLTNLVLKAGSSSATSLPADALAEVDPSAVVPEPSEEVVPFGCSQTLTKDLGLRTTQVNAAGVTYSGATTDFVYTSGASSSLGVAVSESGKYGSWDASGSSSKSTSSSVSYPAYGTGYWARKTQFHYGTYRVGCYYTAGMGVVYSQWYETRPIKWAGGATSYKSTSYPSATYCVTHEAGSSFTRQSSSAVTWSNGVALGGAIGIDLSSHTGYTSDAASKFNFNSRGRMCGTADYPAGTPRTLIAKAP